MVNVAMCYKVLHLLNRLPAVRYVSGAHSSSWEPLDADGLLALSCFTGAEVLRREPGTVGLRSRERHPKGRQEVTSLDIGRTESSEPSPYGGVPEGFMLLYFAAVTLVVLAFAAGSAGVVPGVGSSRSS